MKHKDQAILLRKTNYSESSLILSFFCRSQGVRSFIFQGGKKKQGNILFPLSVLEIEYYSRNESDLGKITSISPEFIFSGIPSHPYKSASVFFLAELLQKVVRQENERDEDFFLFLASEIHELDTAPFEANYPLWFLIELTKWIGIEPQCSSKNARYFDRKEGVISELPENNDLSVESGEHIEVLSSFLNISKDQALRMPLHSGLRNKLLRTVLNYYSEHIQGFSFPKSLEVLEEVFHD